MHCARVRLVLTLVVMALTLGAFSCAREQDSTVFDWEGQRNAMVDMLVARQELRDQRVIQAMRHTPRHLFVPETVRSYAYVDSPLPIGQEQTISAPSIVALMTELYSPSPSTQLMN